MMFFALLPLFLQAQQSVDYRSDLTELLSGLKDYACYVKEDKIDLKRIDAKYRPRLERVADRKALLDTLERVVGEIHDFHASLNTNNSRSPRLVPSGTDVVAVWKGNMAIIEQVKTGSLADQAGLRYGDEVIELQRLPVKKTASLWLDGAPETPRAMHWALNSALAGRWDEERVITYSRSGTQKTIVLKTAAQDRISKPLTVEKRPHGILYLRPEDSLGSNELIKSMDEVIPEMRKSMGIVIDLRNTPSGGTSTVARGIMGIFIGKRLPYQRHQQFETETNTVRDWVEYASPRLSAHVTGRLVVLVGKWTGSMGEGLAIGFDGMKRATVVGTEMAGLRGAIEGLYLPKSGIRVNVPVEKLFHINGTPRHQWRPSVLVVPSHNRDAWFAQAKAILGKN